jgi:3-phenylpropionate/trans-cinnamate dioxygenase ferredoxin reductase component
VQTIRATKYVIVGAGQAGCRAALTLRAADPTAKIVLIGAEPHPPYERPALSKSVLKGTAAPGSVTIRNPGELAALGIELHLGHAAERIDAPTKEVVLEDNRRFSYDRLLLATGSRARPLPVGGSGLRHIHYLRTLDDSVTLANSLKSCRNLVVIGAGFIGLEVAAAAIEHFDCNVTIVEAGPGILQRGAPQAMRSAIHDLHLSHGAQFVFNDSVSAFRGGNSVERVVLASGKTLEADCTLIGIGVIAETNLAKSAGVKIDNGIVTDEFGETSVPGIFAAGEATNHVNIFLNASQRRECWQVAQNQSAVAANSMLGQREAYADIPWFWTDQYDHNFQLIGTTDDKSVQITRHYDKALATTTFFLKNGKIIGALCVNSGKDIRLVREILKHGLAVSPDLLAGPKVNLKAHLKQLVSQKNEPMISPENGGKK